MRTAANKVASLIKQQIKIIAGVSVGLVIGSAASAAVLASVPDGDGIIHGCYRTSGLLANGQMRIIDNATESCNNSETAISWNQSGSESAFADDLVGVDFSEADLRYRSFAGQDMHGGVFIGANLTGTNLSNVNFSNANFGGAIMPNAELAGADLSGANFAEANAFGSDFRNANLSGVSFFGDFRGTNFQNADFSNVTIFGGEVLDGANLTGVDFTTATFEPGNGSVPGAGGTTFVSTDLTDTNFSGITIFGLGVLDSTATNANFAHAQFDTWSFLGTDLSDAVLSGVTWSNTICPDGVNSDNNGNSCIGHLTP